LLRADGIRLVASLLASSTLFQDDNNLFQTCHISENDFEIELQCVSSSINTFTMPKTFVCHLDFPFDGFNDEEKFMKRHLLETKNGSKNGLKLLFNTYD
jgi:hypothetical protein